MSGINEIRAEVQKQYDPLVKEIGDTMLHGPLSVSLREVLEAGFRALPRSGPNDAVVMLHRLVEEEWRRNGNSPFHESTDALPADQWRTRAAAIVEAVAADWPADGRAYAKTLVAILTTEAS